MKNNKKILLAESDLQLRDLYRKRLEINANFLILEASDGEEALSKIKNDKPNLILLDLNIPKLSGIDVLKKLKQKGYSQKIPIIVLSAVDEPTILSFCQDNLEVNYCFVKHNTLPKEIFQSINKLLG